LPIDFTGELDHRGGLAATSVRYDLHSARPIEDGAASSIWWPELLAQKAACFTAATQSGCTALPRSNLW